MPGWLTVVMIVLVLVALSRDLHRNSIEEQTGVRDLDVADAQARRTTVARPRVRDTRSDGRPMSTGGPRRPRTVRLTRGGKPTRRR